MTDPDPRAPDGAFGTDSAFGYRQETPEQRYALRSRNVSVVVAVIAVLVLLAVLGLGFAALFVLHAVTHP
jgi:hypothetical protein